MVFEQDIQMAFTMLGNNGNFASVVYYASDTKLV